MSDGLYRTCSVVRRIQEGQAGATLILDGELQAEPGQFLMVWLPGIEERPLAVMDDSPLSLTIRDIGPFTHAMATLEPGQRVWVRGPYGRGFTEQAEHMLLVGGGSGIASLTLLAKRAFAGGAQVRVALGARTAGQLMLAWRFCELGIPPVIATDDGSEGLRGTVVDAIEPLLAMAWPDAIYACGPEPMLLALGRRLKSVQIPVYMSLERAIKCALGVCGNCHWGELLICRDGPVFRAETALSLLEADE